jgi:hypothetical protein
MHTRIGLVASAAIATFVPLMAQAQTETLDYFGSLFTTLSINGNLSNGLQSTIPQNTGEVVLSSPLAPNLNNVAVNPVFWSFDSSTGFGYLNSNDPQIGNEGNSDLFMFSTDSNGALTSWNLTLNNGISSGTNSPSFASASITNSGDTFATGYSSPSCGAPPGVPVGCYSVSESNQASGNWSATAMQAPELNPASTAGSLTLLFGVIAVLRGRRAS